MLLIASQSKNNKSQQASSKDTMRISHTTQCSCCVLLLHLLMVAEHGWSFMTPQPQPLGLVVVDKKHVSKLQYNSRDEIAHEILELGGDNISKSSNHDRNPWKDFLKKRIVSQQQQEPVIESPEHLTSLMAPTKKEVTVERLQQDLFALFQIAQQLTATELELADELTKLEHERSSIRQLMRRIVVVLKDRFISRIKKMFRWVPFQKNNSE